MKTIHLFVSSGNGETSFGKRIPFYGLAGELKNRGECVEFVERIVNNQFQLNDINPFTTYHRFSNTSVDVSLWTSNTILWLDNFRNLQWAYNVKQRVGCRIILILNDVNYGMYLEEILTIISVYPAIDYKNIIKGLFSPFVYLKERIAYGNCDLVLVQTEKELQKAYGFKSKFIQCINAYSSTPKSSARLGNRFVLNLSNSQKRFERHKYFFENVWPGIVKTKPDLHLDVFGTGENFVPFLENLKNVEFCGYVDDLHEFLSDKLGWIYPMDHRTGVSNNLLYAYSRGVPFVSFQGTMNTVDFLCVDYKQACSCRNWNEFQSKVVSLSERTSHYTLGDFELSWSQNIDRILLELKNV